MSVCIHMPSPVWTSQPFHLSRSHRAQDELPVLYSGGSHQLSVLHMVVYILWRSSQLKSLVLTNPGVRNGNPCQDSCLENCTDRGAWRAAVHGVTKNRAWLNDWALCIYVNPSIPVPPPPSPCLLSTCPFSTPALQIGSSLPGFWFHIYALVDDTCFSLSDLLHSVWWILCPSMSLQMIQFCSFLWPSNIPL